MNLTKHIQNLPNDPGIYKFYDQTDKLIYVGKSVSIKKRVKSYFSNKNLGPKTNKMVISIKRIDYLKVFSEFEALLLESEIIKKNQPFYNVIAKDDKSPIYIKISGLPVATISLVRRQTKKRGIFLVGPFPSAKTTRSVVRLIRKIFPYCHHQAPKKPCLFVHLGLCPYPYDSDGVLKEYQKTISKIKKLLSGKSQTLTKQLLKEMKSLSNEQKFEEAQKIKEQIEKIQYITTTYHTPREFLEQPNLVDDLTTLKLKELKKVLSLPKIPKRLECYDISNILGKMATGSMVVFINGKSKKDQYRRFKIKFSQKPNDYLMIKEVLSRRFKNDWPKPDLIIIDGGKGQLSAAHDAAKPFSIDIKIISIAKRLEEIFTTEKMEPIRLQKNNPARQLVQELRDEAHRFAITYHRLLRSKAFLK